MMHLSSIHKAVFLGMLFSFSLTGCLGSREWDYPPLPEKNYLQISAKQEIPASVTVLPLDDQRGTVVQEEYWKVAIPLVPQGQIIYDRPEEAVDPEHIDLLTFDPPRDFARALADEIREANIFTTVTYADNAAAAPSDYVLRGRLYSTRWERSITTYLLGPLGTVAWMVGLPMGATTTQVEMDLRLTPAGDPTNVLWSFAMQFDGWQRDGTYYGLKEAVQSYPAALQDALRPAIGDLANKASSRIGRL